MFTRWILSILLNAISLLIVSEIFTSFHVEGFMTALLASIVLGLLNFIVRPILAFFAFPITFLTLGLFMFVINAIILMIAQSIFDEAFVIESFGTAIIASVVIAIINALLNRVVRSKR